MTAVGLLRSEAADRLRAGAAAIVAAAGDGAGLAVERGFLDPVPPFDPPPGDLIDLMCVSTALLDAVRLATNSPADDVVADDATGPGVDAAIADTVRQLVRDVLVDLRSLIRLRHDAAKSVVGTLGSRRSALDTEPSGADTIDSLICILYDRPGTSSEPR